MIAAAGTRADTLPRAQVDGAMRGLARTASVEVTPARILDGPDLRALLPAATRVYVPYLPNARYADSINACRKLHLDGMQPVPHLPARAAGSAGVLRDWLMALGDCGVTALLLIAGDRREAAGPFADTLDILESGMLLDHGFRRLGVAGHPEGHPDVARDAVYRALLRKREYANATGTDLWIVSQFVFTSDPLFTWLRDIRQMTGALPVHVGMPGPARLRTLLAYAAHCGVSASARVLRRQPGAARMLGRWTPDGVLRDLVQRELALAQTLFQGLHLFPFGGVEETAAWLQTLCRDPASGSGSEPAEA